MTDRDRLIELVDKAKEEYANDITDHTETDYIVETLLNRGVIVPPCKVGETLFFLYDNTFANRPNFKPCIYKTNDWYFDIDQKGISILPRSIHSYKGKHHYYLDETVFLTKEEAEDAINSLEVAKGG